MVNRKHQNAVWVTRLGNGKPYQTVTSEYNEIWVAFYPGNGGSGYSMKISRADARLLAKRINQCLDATAKK